ncbi:uncharacterized protein TRIADDRAFT_37943 [Trichoplax adhaerens]|uniref:Transmembrane 9 superfamily member n=1 Tax=Trichoplax adhaerens TaxID=10228 RepID=B3S142_TRIAD|nr:hypothetical protein TRIADDRAFT_37943 [Trichoplax adhaerens]EDV23172.1 hypothetical protein TRIADDRAFT_37943 [Trichoplax adhaerens]|eukprot:XP_002114082.1 hypothetical protein TRIADDRAFT_37943 [Trichoplax adhaerens]
MYVNKVGPYFNPHETYHYYSLPICRPQKVEHRSLTLGEVLKGDRMAVSSFNIRFRETFKNKKLCTEPYEKKDIDKLIHAIEELYFFEFIIDDLPIRGFVGHLKESGFIPHSHQVYLWGHFDFFFEYNMDQLISANVSMSNVNPISLENIDTFPAQITYTYSATWKKTKVAYSQRMSKKDTFFQKSLEIHWLSIINSIVLVILLMGFVVIILMRVLRSDFARYNVVNDEEDSLVLSSTLDRDDNGWKVVHADVFRLPKYKSLLSSMLGVGSQFLLITGSILIMAMLKMFNIHRHGSINTAAVLMYALTSFVAGYVSSNFYKKIGGENWVWNIVLTSTLFSAPLFLVWSIENSVAWYYASTQALPFTTVMILVLIWMLVGFPLNVLGGIFGKNYAISFNAPCRTKNIAREIPSVSWYRSGPILMLIGGFIPFSAVSVELYYIFATTWGREQYTLYGILFVVYVILLSVTVCISIALTYFQLSNEDYRWWWRSFNNTGFASFFVFVYAFFYFVKRSNMTGTLQTFEFFGYTLLACYVFYLMLGTVSFYASLTFIRYIYLNLKMD